MKRTTEIDADHTRDLETRRSSAGILLLLNRTLQNWCSKRQHTVETSTYDSELVATRIAVEMIMEYCYKLRMLVSPILRLSVIYGDHTAVITNASIPGSNIKKKYYSFRFYFTREANVAGIESSICKASK